MDEKTLINAVAKCLKTEKRISLARISQAAEIPVDEVIRLCSLAMETMGVAITFEYPALNGGAIKRIDFR